MHGLFAQVLGEKDLSKAGDLFSLEDEEIKGELSDILARIEEITSAKGYRSSDNDQSVVEICITRVTSAIRETGSIEQHAPALIHLLESCLKHPLTSSSKDEEPPHAKIASDILSCIFLNYSQKSVMERALPVAIRFLEQPNTELNRNLSSYLSLAAIDNAKLLAAQIHLILDSIIIHKNLRLSRVLPQLYNENKLPIQDQTGNLIHLLGVCDMAERTHVLQLCSMVAQDKPKLLEPYVPLLCQHLSSTATASLVLQTFAPMADAHVDSFVSQLSKLQKAAEQQPTLLAKVARICGSAGTLNQIQGKECVKYLLSQIEGTDNHTQTVLLKEIKSICEVFPYLLPSVNAAVSPLMASAPSSARLLMQQLKDMSYTSSAVADPEHKTVASQTDGIVTVITIDNNNQLQQGRHGNKDFTARGSLLESASLSTHSKNASTSTREISQFPLKSLSGSAATVHKNKDFLPGKLPLSKSSPTSYPSTSSVAGRGEQHLIPSTRGPSLSAFPSSHSVKSSSPCVAASNGYSAASSMPPVMTSSTVSSRHTSNLALSAQERPTLTSTMTTIVTSVTTITRTTIAGSKAANSGLDLGERRPISTVTTTTTPTYAGQPQAIPYRDAVQQFCEKHLEKIKKYIDSVLLKLPLPIKATMEERKHKRTCKLHFICLGREDHCLYQHTFFTHRTKNPRLWIHLMFLAIQARSSRAVSQQDPAVGNLKATWDTLRMDSGNSFVRLVTSSFPTIKDQEFLLQELRSQRYFDVFEFNAVEKHWACFVCNHPKRALGLMQDGLPSIAGQLKEKKGKWKIFKRWKTRYFTLSGATITYSKTGKKTETLPISKIQSVKAVRKGMRHIPKAFEIFTTDQSYVLKAKDGEKAEQWVQCLHMAVSKNQSQDGGEAAGGPQKVTELESMVQSWSNATRVNHRSRRAFGRINDTQTKL